MFVPWCADPLLAADLFRDETRIEARTSQGKKPHQGVAGEKTALHQGIVWSNSTTALGLRAVTVENRVRSRCTGKKRDSETGLDEFPARYLSSGLGRWITPDPLPWIHWQHGNEDDQKKFAAYLQNPQNFNMYAYVENNPESKDDPTGMQGCQAGDKKFSTCTITITYDKKTSKGTLTVTGQNKGDKTPTVLLTSKVVVGGDGHVTPTGTFTASVWEKDHVSTKYGSAANTPYSKTKFGGNAFGPYQLHIKELDSRGIYIHGTMGPNWSPVTWGNSIFLSPASHGCVRMCNADDNRLHDIMPNPAGNKIIIGTLPEN